MQLKFQLPKLPSVENLSDHLELVEKLLKQEKLWISTSPEVSLRVVSSIAETLSSVSDVHTCFMECLTSNGYDYDATKRNVLAIFCNRHQMRAELERRVGNIKYSSASDHERFIMQAQAAERMLRVTFPNDNSEEKSFKRSLMKRLPATIAKDVMALASLNDEGDDDWEDLPSSTLYNFIRKASRNAAQIEILKPKSGDNVRLANDGFNINNWVQTFKAVWVISPKGTSKPDAPSIQKRTGAEATYQSPAGTLFLGFKDQSPEEVSPKVTTVATELGFMSRQFQAGFRKGGSRHGQRRRQ